MNEKFACRLEVKKRVNMKLLMGEVRVFFLGSEDGNCLFSEWPRR